jgi:hypothetical protein
MDHGGSHWFEPGAENHATKSAISLSTVDCITCSLLAEVWRPRIEAEYRSSSCQQLPAVTMSIGYCVYLVVKRVRSADSSTVVCSEAQSSASTHRIQQR